MARKVDSVDAVDQMIAARIRYYREQLGMTQGELAARIGVSYQQIHKYENGSNRLSAGRLGVVSEALRIPVQTFYEEAILGGEVQGIESENHRIYFDVARHFRQIRNSRHQEALHLLIRVLAQKED